MLAIARDTARRRVLAAAHPGRITPLSLDLADAVIAPPTARALKGTPRIDGLVNPGIVATDFGAADGQTLEGTRGAEESLRPSALAALIVRMLEQPGSMLVDELTVHPLGQAAF